MGIAIIKLVHAPVGKVMKVQVVTNARSDITDIPGADHVHATLPEANQINAMEPCAVVMTSDNVIARCV